MHWVNTNTYVNVQDYKAVDEEHEKNLNSWNI